MQWNLPFYKTQGLMYNISLLKWGLYKKLVFFYKITMIVRTLLLAERSVCMRVCKHGCDMRCFAFCALIMQARIWKSFSDQNSTSLLLFTHSFVGWNVENLLIETSCVTFFGLSWHFKREKSVFLESIFLQNKNWLCMQDFVYKTFQLVRISLTFDILGGELLLNFGAKFQR